MEGARPAEKAALYWMAGHEYLRASRFEQAERMIGESEDATTDLETEVYFLRSELSSAQERYKEALFYLESLASTDAPEEVRKLAARRLACARMRLNNTDGAREALQDSSQDHRKTGLAAIAAYEAGRDKSPTVGGLLGLIPGLGYAYSGEYANAMRSLIMNALCIWGIVEFAEDENWGGTAVVGFAGLTFYSGSIYGGADAAVRHNRRRLEACLRIINDNARFEPDTAKLPILALKYEF